MARLRPDMYVLSAKHIVLWFSCETQPLRSHNATIRTECLCLDVNFHKHTLLFRHSHRFYKTKYFCSLDYTNCSLVIKITITYNLISLLKEPEREGAYTWGRICLRRSQTNGYYYYVLVGFGSRLQLVQPRLMVRLVVYVR